MTNDDEIPACPPPQMKSLWSCNKFLINSGLIYYLFLLRENLFQKFRKNMKEN